MTNLNLTSSNYSHCLARNTFRHDKNAKLDVKYQITQNKSNKGHFEFKLSFVDNTFELMFAYYVKSLSLKSSI